MTELRERELIRPDGRLVAWTELGERRGHPLIRFPGTPGCRWSVPYDQAPWREREVWMITTERPGFGRSTPLPGRGFAEHADDVASVLDHLGIDRAHVWGGSGGAPHVLSFCARHPHRVSAATVLVGIAPLRDDEAESMIPHNAEVFRLVVAGDRPALERVLARNRDAILENTQATFAGLMANAPAEDLRILGNPDFFDTFERAIREALAQGIDGWADEDMAIFGEWADIDLSAIATSIMWYHAAGDRNAPLSAVKRLLSRIPTASLVEWPESVGHLHGFRIEADLLDELLARGDS